jgi:hypothetical protein
MTLRKIKYLKIDNNSDWLAYQRGLPKDIRGKAKTMQIPLSITRPLGLTKAASVAEITAAIEQHNKVFDDVCRMLRSTSEGTADKKQLMENAKAAREKPETQKPFGKSTRLHYFEIQAQRRP